MRTAIGALLVSIALAAVPAAASADPHVDGSFSISNERTVTRWGNAFNHAPIRLKPHTAAHKVASAHGYTEDGFPEVYIALRKWKAPGGKIWLKIRIPMRPNGRTGWVRASTLGGLHALNVETTQLVVDRNSLRARLYNRGKKIWNARVGVGKSSTPTPGGQFWIREKFKTGDAGGAYGPAAFGTSAYSVLSEWPGGGVIGIHGTDAPSLIPGRPSHGCIRIQNGPLMRLWKKLPVGTPLLIK